MKGTVHMGMHASPIKALVLREPPMHETIYVEGLSTSQLSFLLRSAWC